MDLKGLMHINEWSHVALQQLESVCIGSVRIKYYIVWDPYGSYRFCTVNKYDCIGSVRVIRLVYMGSVRVIRLVYMGSVWFRTYETDCFNYIYQVPKDGDCLYSSIRACLQIGEDSMMDKLYQSRNVKHQAIAHYLEFRELMDDDVLEMIRMEYGRVDSEFGPFSVKDYFKFINRSREFGDTIMIKIIASMWAVKITILRSDSLSEMRFRHDSELDAVDMVLVYNSKPVNGHYSPAICVEGGQAETLEIREDLQGVSIMIQKWTDLRGSLWVSGGGEKEPTTRT